MGGELELQIAIERLVNRLADEQLVQVLEIGQTLEEEDARHQAFRVTHLVDRFLALVLRKTLESPVVEHLCVEKILVDRRQLVHQYGIQPRDNLGVTLHPRSPCCRPMSVVSSTTPPVTGRMRAGRAFRPTGILRTMCSGRNRGPRRGGAQGPPTSARLARRP